jgi:antitoxin component YwqK of YwqJK toxin-antitoxin module
MATRASSEPAIAAIHFRPACVVAIGLDAAASWGKAMRNPLLRRTSLACLILISITVAGCNSSTGDTSGAATKADDAVTTSTATTAVSQTQTAGDKDNKPQASKGSDIPPPIVIGRGPKKLLLPDGTIFQEFEIKVFSDNSSVQDGRFTEYYPSGEKCKEGNKVDNVMQGPWHYWYDNGQEAKTENYVNGKLDGQWKQFNEKGVLQDEVSWKADKKDGRFTKYYDDGKQPKEQQEYREGKRNGTWIQWYPNGKKKVETHYVDDVQSGLQQAWWDSGQLAAEETFSKGERNGKRTTFDKSGAKLSETEYLNGKPVEKTATKGR